MGKMLSSQVTWRDMPSLAGVMRLSKLPTMRETYQRLAKLLKVSRDQVQSLQPLNARAKAMSHTHTDSIPRQRQSALMFSMSGRLIDVLQQGRNHLMGFQEPASFPNCQGLWIPKSN